MEKFVKRDVIVLPFPFSDLSNSKRRPTLVVATLKDDDIILCQITSEAKIDDYSIVITDEDFKGKSLNQVSMIRPNKLFTADKSIIIYKVGSIKENKIKEVEKELIKIFSK